MDVQTKKQWSVDEINCLLALWSSTEVQKKLDGATRTKPVLQQIQREMAAAGFNKSVGQINNKLKKLKKEYRDQQKDLGRSGSCRPHRNPHFDVLDSVLGDRPTFQPTGALNSATLILEGMANNSLEKSHTDPGKFYFTLLLSPASSLTKLLDKLSAINDGDDLEFPPPLSCSSPSSLSRSSGDACTSSAQNKHGKRKRDSISELVAYLERADERFFQHSKDMENALLQQMSATHGLMEHMLTTNDKTAQ
ncbi:uncharacterized protein LOC113637542 [Tachysurus fulvidraco]|uniref:uncharacterized protein LOC113637542 n=1 Tax=Tachysurus fulvidraco TaxID=1234273 RepID=UPI001FEF9BE4|nr:uncharacterized protein LOC113637542 [Tachysurus fulvidraco]